MKDDEMLYCLIAFILGWFVSRHIGDGFSVGGQKEKGTCLFRGNSLLSRSTELGTDNPYDENFNTIADADPIKSGDQFCALHLLNTKKACTDTRHAKHQDKPPICIWQKEKSYWCKKGKNQKCPKHPVSGKVTNCDDIPDENCYNHTNDLEDKNCRCPSS